MSKHLFSGVLLAGILSSTVAVAHVSIPSGPAAADKSAKITLGIGHGCEVAGVHYDTLKVRVVIPTGMTGVRALISDFDSRPTITKPGTQVTEILWERDPADLLPGDDGYYEITIRGKVPNTPYAQIPITVEQTCLVGGNPVTLTWDQPPGSTTGNPAPVLTIVPSRLNPTGWNKFTIPVGTTVPAAKLGAYFGDALIVWKGTAAFSANLSTVALIGTTAGVTALTADLVAGDEVWARY